MVLVFKYFFYKNFVGLSVWPFIILKSKKLKCDATLVNHEKIHLRQQLELLVVFFYVWYLLEWFYGLLYYKNAAKAYENISFEQEAYANQGDLEYLSSRKPFQFIRYLWGAKTQSCDY